LVGKIGAVPILSDRIAIYGGFEGRLSKFLHVAVNARAHLRFFAKRIAPHLRIGKYAGMEDEPDPIEIPIDGVLDLHQFRPSDIKYLLADYFEACLEKGILDVRVIHGKGIGTLRETVHAQLKKSPMVETFQIGDLGSGSWGATLVRLKSGE